MKKLEKISNGIMNSKLLGKIVGGFAAGAAVFGLLSWAVYNARYGPVGLYTKEGYKIIEGLSSAEQFELALGYSLVGGIATAGMFSAGYGIECLMGWLEKKEMEKWAREHPETMKYYERPIKTGESKEKK